MGDTWCQPMRLLLEADQGRGTLGPLGTKAFGP